MHDRIAAKFEPEYYASQILNGLGNLQINLQKMEIETVTSTAPVDSWIDRSLNEGRFA